MRSLPFSHTRVLLFPGEPSSSGVTPRDTQNALAALRVAARALCALLFADAPHFRYGEEVKIISTLLSSVVTPKLMQFGTRSTAPLRFLIACCDAGFLHHGRHSPFVRNCVNKSTSFVHRKDLNLCGGKIVKCLCVLVLGELVRAQRVNI
jgi:hypothetical protein